MAVAEFYHKGMIEVAYSSFCLFCGKQHKNKHFGVVGRAGRHPKAFGLTLKKCIFLTNRTFKTPNILFFYYLYTDLLFSWAK